MERNGGLEVEVVQARGLTMKPGSKAPPGDSDTSLLRLVSFVKAIFAGFYSKFYI